MSVEQNLSIQNPRAVARDAVKSSIPPSTWEQNLKFSHSLIEKIKSHRINQHPVLQLFASDNLNQEVTKILHLEAAYAFAQVFTDSLVQAMVKTTEMEERFNPQAKVSARFLLQLNLLDELGFVPTKNNDEYAGNPFLAHYLQFMETLKELGADQEEVRNYKASPAAEACRKTFTDNYDDYSLLLSVLAAAETVFTNFAGPWARSVAKSTDIDVSKGYHNIHVEDESGHFLDDDHAEDSWYLVRQAISSDRFEEIEDLTLLWLDTWNDFLDNAVHIARKMLKKT